MSDVTFGVKMPEEFKLQIENLMKNSGLRTGKDFMQSLINSYVLEKTKETIPEAAEDLKELQILTQRIDNIYLNLGYRIENITKAQQEQQQQLLSKKDAIILDLQSKNDILIDSKDKIIEENKNIVNQNSEYLQRVNELTDSNINIKALNEEYKSKVDTLSGIIEEYKGYKTEIETVKVVLASQQADNISLKDNIKEKDFVINGLNKDIDKSKEECENYKTENETVKGLLADAQTDNIELKDTLKDKDFTINGLKKDTDKEKAEYEKFIGELNSKHSAEIKQIENDKTKEIDSIIKDNLFTVNELTKNIDKLAMDHQKEIENIKEKTIFQIDKKELELSQLHQKAIEELNNKHNAAVTEYQLKYKDLLEKMEQTKTATNNSHKKDEVSANKK